MELEHVLIILLIVVVVYALSPDIERDTIKFVTGKHVGSGINVDKLQPCIGTMSDTGCSRYVNPWPGSFPVRYNVKFAWADGISTNTPTDKYYGVFVQCPKRSLKPGEKLEDHTPFCKKNTR